MKDSLQLSLEESRVVRGHEIKRLKLGEFLRVFGEIGALAAEIMTTRIQNGESAEAAKTGRIPRLSEQMVHVACELMLMDEAKIMDDPQIGLDGFYEILAAWIEMNGVDRFWGGGTNTKRRTRQDKDKIPPTEFWLQRLIMQAQSLGIGKRQLLEDYYFDEINILLEEWNILHGAECEWEEEVSPQAFLSM